MLTQITPVLLTRDEEPNIGRALSCLTWARDIVVVDSGSTDRTVEIAKSLPQVRVFERAFDSHARQWQYATSQTGIATKWLLRLDADYQVSDALVQEMAALEPGAAVDAYRIGFDYAIFGHHLVSSFYPPNTVLLRQGRFTIEDQGHTERWLVPGSVAVLTARIVHDDWKSVDKWLASQARYMAKEATFLDDGKAGAANWLRRRPPLMPVATFLYCLFGRGLVFSGRAGVFYALQRLVAEAVLSLMVLEKRLAPPTKSAEPRS